MNAFLKSGGLYNLIQVQPLLASLRLQGQNGTLYKKYFMKLWSQNGSL